VEGARCARLSGPAAGTGDAQLTLGPGRFNAPGSVDLSPPPQKGVAGRNARRGLAHVPGRWSVRAGVIGEQSVVHPTGSARSPAYSDFWLGGCEPLLHPEAQRARCPAGPWRLGRSEGRTDRRLPLVGVPSLIRRRAPRLHGGWLATLQVADGSNPALSGIGHAQAASGGRCSPAGRPRKTFVVQGGIRFVWWLLGHSPGPCRLIGGDH